MHTIEISYTTGVSFGSQDCLSRLEYTWTQLEFVQQSLARIAEHYKWYMARHNNFVNNLPTPSFAFENNEARIMLILDNGVEQSYGAFWIGYFEHLLSAKIVLDLPEITF